MAYERRMFRVALVTTLQSIARSKQSSVGYNQAAVSVQFLYLD